ncbi:hypothetical protein EJF36_12345 [Bacillus sp. HMF5848]|uniref:hypothetical protein n=1 Tax=Bacillus sp. HMF5848 TaxID=2495421 RepID=UPI000F771768|nr:hypothetical protein [Bacillus sp. HMF5848]RSK27603.1 hypothetical protein EJF36_12345 [Bacillus sp. HMF5848]
MNKRKKKNKNLGPRRKRWGRKVRMENAKEWVKTYTGKNIIKGYSKWYAVDLICAMNELEMLGYPITEKQKKGVYESIETKKKQKEARKLKRQQDELSDFEEAGFAFVAGYTEGGMPFGITWDELDESDEDFISPSSQTIDIDDEDLPF